MDRIRMNRALNAQVSQTLQKEHRVLNELTQELHKRLNRATWVSESNATFQQILAKYNVHMAELHHELNRLGVALQSATDKLDMADRRAGKAFG